MCMRQPLWMINPKSCDITNINHDGLISSSPRQPAVGAGENVAVVNSNSKYSSCRNGWVYTIADRHNN